MRRRDVLGSGALIVAGAATTIAGAEGAGVMIGRPNNELAPPPMSTDRDAREILRVWAKPNAPQQLSLQTAWRDPGAWGLMLADLARHVARAYAQEGLDEGEALQRVLSLFKAEMEAPTDTPEQMQ